MEKVYIVVHEDYDSGSIHGVFPNRDMAEAHAGLLRLIDRYSGGDFVVQEHAVVTEQPVQIFAYYTNLKTGHCRQIIDNYTTICEFGMDGTTVLSGENESVVGVGLTVEEAAKVAAQHRARILAERGIKP